jgi:hypothetical protein
VALFRALPRIASVLIIVAAALLAFCLAVSSGAINAGSLAYESTVTARAATRLREGIKLGVSAQATQGPMPSATISPRLLNQLLPLNARR